MRKDFVGRTNITAGDTTLIRYLYTSQEYDLESGLYHYDARYYDPTTGKLISEDIIGFDAGDANLYRYVGNEPTTLVDPSGMRSYRRVVKKGRFHYADYGGEGVIWWDSTDTKAAEAAFDLIRETNAGYGMFGAIRVSMKGTGTQAKAVYTTDWTNWQPGKHWAPPPLPPSPGVTITSEGPGGQTTSYVIYPRTFMRSVVNVFGKVLLEGVGGTMFSAQMGDSKALDAVQEKAGYIGLLPWVGEPVDLVNAGVSFLRGNYVQAAWYTTAAVPVVGMAFASSKMGKRFLGAFRHGGDEASDIARGVARNLPGKIAGTRGLNHSYKHAIEANGWFARHGGTPSLKAWQEVIEQGAQSKKIVNWATGADKTRGHLARIGGNKWLFVQFFKEGPRKGELATAFIPNNSQLQAIQKALGR